MTALVLENLAALPAQMQSLKTILARLARSLDALVSARAARAVPEWQMQKVQTQIARYCALLQTAVRPTQCNRTKSPARFSRNRPLCRMSAEIFGTVGLENINFWIQRLSG